MTTIAVLENTTTSSTMTGNTTSNTLTTTYSTEAEALVDTPFFLWTVSVVGVLMLLMILVASIRKIYINKKRKVVVNRRL